MCGASPVTGEHLRARRLALGLSQRRLAMLLGVSEQTIGKWERGAVRIRWPGILSLALEAIEMRFERDGLLPPSPTR
jgi:transcriptional regulator with XRE-family HTH domain